MKKIFANSILIVIAIIMVFLSSCADNNLNIGTTDDGERAILLSFGQTFTRGIDAPIPANTRVAFNTGILYLVNGDGVILDHYIIVERSSSVTGANIINRAAFDNSFLIEGVSGNVRRLVVVGNTAKNHSDNSLPTSGMISAVEAQAIQIFSQYDVNNLNVFGSGELTPTFTQTPAGQPIHTCTIILAPTVARIEIADITGMGEIESFTVEGIFIEEYFLEARINGTIPANLAGGGSNTPVINYDDPVSYTGHEVAGSAYESDTKNALHDWRGSGWISVNRNFPAFGTLPVASTGTRSDDVNGDEQNNVWSYHVFAQHHSHNFDDDAFLTRTPFPYIVIRLNNIVRRDGMPINGVRFLTIDRYNDVDGNPITGMRASDVYRIPEGRLVFDENMIHTKPREVPIAVTIDVIVALWNDVNIIPPTRFRQPNPENAPAPIELGGTHQFILGAATGGSWTTISYRWQMSTTPNISASWSNISGATGQNLTTPELIRSTWFRRVAIDNGTGQEIFSHPALVALAQFPVQDNPVAGTIVRDQNNTITLAAATNHDGTPLTGITYQWQSSNNNSTWTNISGATSLNYTIPMNSVNFNTYFRRIVIWNGTDFPSEGALWNAPLWQENLIPPTDNSIDETHTWIFNLAPAIGGAGNFSYIWQYRVGSGEWNDVRGTSTTGSYTLNADLYTDRLTDISYQFRRLATSQANETIESVVNVQVRAGVVVFGTTVRWATRNLDTWVNTGSNIIMMYAANPQDAGQLFKWNNSTAFERVTSGSGISSATLDVAWTLNHNASAAATTWQVANNPCPADWRVPTAAELTSLAGVVSTDNTLEGVTGRWFGSGDNRIFLPTTGERANNASGTFSQGTTHGYYWSASPRGTGTTLARGMVFQATGTPTIDPTTTSAAGRGLGRAVRCVR